MSTRSRTAVTSSGAKTRPATSDSFPVSAAGAASQRFSTQSFTTSRTTAASGTGHRSSPTGSARKNRVYCAAVAPKESKETEEKRKAAAQAEKVARDRYEVAVAQ